MMAVEQAGSSFANGNSKIKERDTMEKKFLSVLLPLMMLFTLISCGKTEQAPSNTISEKSSFDGGTDHDYIEEYVAGNIKDLCKKRHVSKYRLAQLTGIAQSSLGRIVANESTPSLQTLEKICSALDVTLSQFFQDEKENHLTDKQNEVMEIWNDLSADEQAVVLAMLRGLKK